MPSLLPPPGPRARSQRARIILIVALLAIFLLPLWPWTQRFGEAEDFAHIEAQFKYGSIGSDIPFAQASLPYWLWKVLPGLITPGEALPKYRSGNGYETFGFVIEAPRDLAPLDRPKLARPIGFSNRRVLGMEFVGMNCAICHISTFRPSEREPRQVVLGGTGNAIDIERYFRFLFMTVADPKVFNAKKVMPLLEAELESQHVDFPWWQRLGYRYAVIPFIQHYAADLQLRNFDFIDTDPKAPGHLPDFGPGRVDTWSLYKRMFVRPQQRDGVPGVSDFPAVWNQKVRAGMRVHWDGNNYALVERNVTASLSLIGTRLHYLDFERMNRVGEWIRELMPPRYADRSPVPVDLALAQQGSTIFAGYCAECHSLQGARIGRVEPIDDLQTDPTRFTEFTPELRDGLNRLGTDQWQVRNYSVEHGYVNKPLDGGWLLAPYLHNGSVPTLRELLTAPDKRPDRFCRGSEVYDWNDLGYSWRAVDNSKPVPTTNEDCPGQFFYDTRIRGNGNKGHRYGTSLGDSDKKALIEFLKTM